jgi:glycosyltransferase involved in cell wall biosynthesis
MVTTFYPPFHFGGDGIFVYRLSEALAEYGHAVDIIHSIDAYRLQHPADPEVSFAHHPNVKRHALETQNPHLSILGAHQLGRPAAYAARLRALLEDGDYDVIHFHNVSLMGAPDVLRRGRAIKLYTAHDYWLACPTHVLFRFKEEPCVKRKCLRCQLVYRRPPQLWRYSSLMRRCLREIDCLLAPSRFTMNRLQRDGLDCPMTVLPHFVPAPSDKKNQPNVARPYFLYVGRMEKLKGVQEIIRIFAHYREADLIIAGEGDYAPILRAGARGLENIHFLGRVPSSHLSDLYRGAVAFLAPSLCYETFGLSAAEALAHGTPVIARRIGALAELIEQSDGGILFDTSDECRKAIEQLGSNRELREKLGENGRAAYALHWTVEAHLARYLDLIRALSAQRVSTPGAERAQKLTAARETPDNP